MTAWRKICWQQESWNRLGHGIELVERSTWVVKRSCEKKETVILLQDCCLVTTSTTSLESLEPPSLVLKVRSLCTEYFQRSHRSRQNDRILVPPVGFNTVASTHMACVCSLPWKCHGVMPMWSWPTHGHTQDTWQVVMLRAALRRADMNWHCSYTSHIVIFCCWCCCLLCRLHLHSWCNSKKTVKDLLSLVLEVRYFDIKVNQGLSSGWCDFDAQLFAPWFKHHSFCTFNIVFNIMDDTGTAANIIN